MSIPKQVLIDIDIRAEDIKSANAAMVEAQKKSALYFAEIQRLKTAQAENNALMKVGAITSDDYAKKTVELTSQQRTATKGLQESNKEYANNKIVVDAAKGSNEQLKAQLALLTKEYNGLSKEQRETGKHGAELQGQILGITNKLKENESAVGDNRRSVGNYEGALRNVLGAMRDSNGALKGFGGGLLGVADGFKVAGGGVKGFGMALMSLGLPLIIAGISALVNVFKQFAPVAEAVEATIVGLKAAFGALISGNSIGEAVKQSQALLQTMRDLEDTQNAFNTMSEKTSNQIASIITQSKDRTKTDQERIDLLKQANVLEKQLFDANVERVNRLLEDEKKAFLQKTKLTEAEFAILSEGTGKQAVELRNRVEDIEAFSEEELASIQGKQLQIAQFEGESAILKDKLANRSNALQEEMSKVAQDASDKQAEAANKLAEKRAAALAKEREDALTHSREMRQIADDFALSQLEDTERKFVELGKELNRLREAKVSEVDIERYASEKIAQIEQEESDKKLAIQAKAFNDYIELLDLREQVEISSAETSIKNDTDLAAAKNKITIDYMQQRLAAMLELAWMDEKLTEQEINNLKLLDDAIKRVKGTMSGEDGAPAPTIAEFLGMSEKDFASMQAGMQSAIDLLGAAQQIIAFNADQRKNEIDERLQSEISAIEASTASEEDKAKRIKALERRAAQEKYKIELDQFNSAKALSIIMAVISTAQAVINGLNAGLALGPAGVVAGPIMAATAGALGAVQIGLIAAQQPPSPPKLAHGGVLVGASHEQGGIPITVNGRGGYEAEGDEIVLTKNVFRDPHLRQMASDLNVAGGGVPIVSRAGRFATGGALGGSQSFAARSASAAQSISPQQMAAMMADAVSGQPAPIVRVSDINRVAGNQRRVQASAELR
jgi:hypothetical protein